MIIIVIVLLISIVQKAESRTTTTKRRLLSAAPDAASFSDWRSSVKERAMEISVVDFDYESRDR
jgi:hypothetical protein